jgi:glycogen debranching enzyme
VASTLGHTDGAVTLVEGQTFCLSGRTGDVSPDLPHGLFVLDTRVLSTWQLRVNGFRLEPLTVDVPEPFTATFVGRAHPAAGRADADVVAVRERHIGQGMRERISLTNYGSSDHEVVVEMYCDVDFADLFEVKENRVGPRGETASEHRPNGLRYTHRGTTIPKVVELEATEDTWVSRGSLSWTVTLAPRQTWSTCVQLVVTFGDEVLTPRFTCVGADDVDTLPAQRLAAWRATLPEFETDHAGFATTLHQAGEDLGSLRIFDPDHPDVPILAAGAPWFMTVFGRDSLLTAWMTMIADATRESIAAATVALRPRLECPPTTACKLSSFKNCCSAFMAWMYTTASWQFML